jgi:hypothetical protein
VLRLVRSSEEARAYLGKLRQDRERLRALPRQQLPADFAERVLRQLPERRQRSRQVPLPPPRRTIPAWLGVATAAAVLLIVGAGAFSYFAHTLNHGPEGGSLAQGQDNSTGTSPAPENGSQNAVASGTAVENPGPKDQTEPGDLMTPPQDLIGQKPKDSSQDQPAPQNNPPKADALGGPLPVWELFGPRTATVTVPLVLKLSELTKNVTDLRQELQQDTGFRIELPCRDSARAFERLQAACKAQNLSLLVDQDVQKRFKQPNLHTNFVLFTEEVTPEDLIKLVEQVAGDETKAEAKRKGDGTFNGLLVFRMDKDDRDELAGLLGIDAKQVQGGRPGNPLNIDPKVPLSEQTAKEIAAALSGSGGTPRGTEPKTTGKGSEPRVLVLPYNPVRVRPGSAEVKRFLEGRKPLQKGSIQVLLVVREVKG